MYTLNGVWAIIAGSATIAADEVNRLYWKLLSVAAGLAGLVFVQWVINSAGAPGLNFIFFFSGGALILAMGFSPIRGPGTGAVIGTVFAALRDTDLSQGALAGILGWMRGVMILLFGYWVVSGLLATWPFSENPLAFWPIAAMGCVLGTTAVVYGLKGKMLPKIITLYAVGVIVLAAFTTMPILQGWLPEELKTDKKKVAATVPQRQVEVPRAQQVTPTVCDNQKRMEVSSTSWSEASHTPGCRLNWARSTHPGVLLVEYHFSGGKRSMECPIGCRLDDSREVHTYRFRVKPGTGEKVVVLVKDIPPK